MADPIAVHVLTGFLGAGKTTLLNRLLAHPGLADTAVVVNEFGEIGIDHLLVEGAVDNVVLLDGGCLCCVASGSLRETLADLYVRRATGGLPPFRRVVIETSGLADPAPILQTIQRDPLLKGRFAARALVCVVEATGGDLIGRQPEAQAQVALADRLVVSKTDRVGAAAAAATIATLAAVNPAAVIVRAEAVAGDPLLLTGGDAPAVRLGSGAPHHHVHDSGVGSVSLVREAPTSWVGIAAWTGRLKARWGEDLLRVKALLPLAGEARPALVQGVRGLFDIGMLAAWPDADRRGRIVAIGRGLDLVTIEADLALLDGGV